MLKLRTCYRRISCGKCKELCLQGKWCGLVSAIW